MPSNAARFGLAVLMVLGAASSNCSKSRTSTQPVNAPPPVASASADSANDPPAEVHNQGRGKNRDCVVYVDGKPVGVLRRSELPTSLKPHVVTKINGMNTARFFSLYEYLVAVGVDVARIKEIQLYGSHSRVASVDGDEFKKYKNDLYFDFTAETRGKARARWELGSRLRNSTSIDNIFGMTIYIEKAPPVWDDEEGALVWPDHSVVDGIPYNDDEIPKGTRVYVDGKLAGWVKRKLLPNSILSARSTDAKPLFSLSAWLKSMGVDASKARAIDFLDSDDVISHVDAKAWTAENGDYAFSIPRRGHGKVLETFPGNKQAKISAVELFVRMQPPVRAIDSSLMDQQSGSDEDQSDDENGAAQNPQDGDEDD